MSRFEFNDIVGGTAGVTPGSIQIDFDPSDTPEQVIAAISQEGAEFDTHNRSSPHSGGDRIVINGPRALIEHQLSQLI